MSAALSQSVGLSLSAPQEPVRAVPAARHGWIEKLICTEGPAILRMLWKLLGDEQDVLDAYQDCWCSLAAMPRPEGVRSAKAFAYRTATNIAVEMIRRKARRREHWPDVVESRTRETQPVDAAMAAEADGEGRLDLRGAIARLPQHLQNVIVLRDLGRLSYKEVSRILGIEGGTARVYRRQAVLRLAELLEERPSP